MTNQNRSITIIVRDRKFIFPLPVTILEKQANWDAAHIQRLVQSLEYKTESFSKIILCRYFHKNKAMRKLLIRTTFSNC